MVDGPDGGLVGDRPAGAEEDPVHAGGRQGGDPGGQLGGGQVGVAGEDLPVTHPRGLVPDCLHHLGPPVADVDAPQPRVGVEQAIALGVLQVAPGAPHVHVLRGDLGGGQLAEGVDDVGAVLPDRPAIGPLDGHGEQRSRKLSRDIPSARLMAVDSHVSEQRAMSFPSFSAVSSGPSGHGPHPTPDPANRPGALYPSGGTLFASLDGSLAWMGPGWTHSI